VLGLEFSKIATENIKAKYKARFAPHPNKEGYLFSHEDYGEGVFCSKEQYASLADEFEHFVERRSRFMFWWFVLLIVLGVTLGVIDIFYYKLGFLHSKTEYDYWIGVAFMLLPLLLFVPQGWRLFQKPLEILGGDRAFVKSKKSAEDILDRRVKGISWEMILLGLVVSLTGIYFERTGSYDSPYLIYLFIGVLLEFLYFGWRKYRAHRKEREILERQEGE